MVIVYNPPTGAPIKGFNFQGKVVELHDVKESKYYEADMAQALVDTYPFLSILTPEEAKALQEEKVAEVDPAIAVAEEAPLYVAKKDRKSKAEVDPAIPVADLKNVIVKEDDKSTEIPDDLKGTDWYGDGPKESHDDQ